MNKTRKGFLTASSIISLVSSVVTILMSLFCFLLGTMITEKFMVEIYKEDEIYTYYEEADGDYYFTYEEEGQEFKLTESDIEMVSKIISTLIYAVGVVNLIVAALKIVFASRILLYNSRNKYAKGSVITLLVVSILNFNILEAVLIIVGMSVQDSIKNNEANVVVE